jgi:hypothetical protein
MKTITNNKLLKAIQNYSSFEGQEIHDGLIAFYIDGGGLYFDITAEVNEEGEIFISEYCWNHYTNGKKGFDWRLWTEINLTDNQELFIISAIKEKANDEASDKAIAESRANESTDPHEYTGVTDADFINLN